MRDETVTNRKPKTTTKMAAIRLANIEVSAPGMGLKVRNAHIMMISSTEPPTVTEIGRSFSVRRFDCSPLPAPSCFKLARSAETMVGMVFSKVIKPAIATAPAPMGLT